MQRPESLLCLDLSADVLTGAEFLPDVAGGLRLVRCAVRPLSDSSGHKPASGWPDPAALEPLLAGHTFDANRCLLGIPAGPVRFRFLQLPPTPPARLAATLRAEAQQFLPWPLEQTLWDYQLLALSEAGEPELLIAGTCAEPLERWVRTVERLGSKVALVDPAPCAIANAFRFNYGDLEGGSLLLDVRRRFTTLFLFDGERAFFRTLDLNPVGPPAADALGAADESRHRSVTPSFLNRLCLQAVQCLSLVRQQHRLALPQRLFLAGPLAADPELRDVLARKLALPFQPFNPLRRVALSPECDRGRIESLAPGLGSSVGLALRAIAHCPLELDLMPPAIARPREQRRQAAWLAAAAAGLALVLFGFGAFLDRAAAQKREVVARRQPALAHAARRARQLELTLARRDASSRAADRLAAWMNARFQWPDLLDDLRRALAAAEADLSQPGRRAGLWIERLEAELPEEAEPDAPARTPSLSPRLRLPQTAPILAANPGPKPSRSPPPAPSPIAEIRLVCRGVSWQSQSPTADTALALAFVRHLQNSSLPVPGPDGVAFQGSLDQDPLAGTFRFETRLRLRNPIAL